MSYEAPDAMVLNPISAVTHPDPYPYYAQLMSTSPMYDDTLKIWIALDAASVTAILESSAYYVCPRGEPILAPISSSPCGALFGDLMRMNDGVRHDVAKVAIGRALAALPLNKVAESSLRLAQQYKPAVNTGFSLTDWIYGTSLRVLAELLGFPADATTKLPAWTHSFVACLSPMSTSAQLTAADHAAVELQTLMLALLRRERMPGGALLEQVIIHAQSIGWSDENQIAANLVGLLSQTYEATAGLIGNSVVQVANHPGLLQEVQSRDGGWDELVQEVSRYDAPIQNTRRYAHEGTYLGTSEIPPNSAMLVILAAANRDARANPRPQEFLLDRPNRRTFTFGRGSHTCPGESLARTIAAATVAVLFDKPPYAWLERLTWVWKPSINARVPIFQIS